jgi:PEP-CTERM motif
MKNINIELRTAALPTPAGEPGTRKLNARKRAHWRRAIFCATSLVLICAVGREAGAGPLVYSDITLTTVSSCFGDCINGPPGGDLEHTPAPKTVSDGSNAEAESLVEPSAWTRFLRPGPSLGGFVSAAMNGQKVAGVGASGIVRSGGGAYAQALFEQTITNPTLDSITPQSHIRVPFIDVLTSHSEGGSLRDVPARGIWQAEAKVTMNVVLFDADGTELQNYNAFLLDLTVDRTNVASEQNSVTLDLTHTVAPGDLLQPFFARPFPNRDAIGYVMNPLEDTFNLLAIPAGGHLDVSYSLEASFSINGSDGDDRTAAFQVRIGDPFNISAAGPGFTIEEVTDVSPVPEPASVLLLGCGLLMLFARQRREDIERL